MDVSTCIRMKLDELGLAPAQLAKKAGVSRQYVNSLLNGDTKHFRLDKAWRIAHALGMTADELADALYGGDVA
jgi:transcriptional regulator with XRE-family HTH domain